MLVGQPGGEGSGGRLGAVRGRASDRSREWSPTHPERHLSSPIKDPPHFEHLRWLVCQEGDWLAGGLKSVWMLGLSQAKQGGVGRIETGETQMSQEECRNY